MTDHLHERLRELRLDRGLSLREMAARIATEGDRPVSHDSVRHYEDGRSVPSDYLATVCSAFHVSPDWLFFGRGSMRSRPASDAAAALEAVGDIVRAFLGEKEGWRTDGWTEATKRRWRTYAGTLAPDDPVRRITVESWCPPADSMESEEAEPRKDRVTDEDLTRRTEALASLVRAASPHLDWLSFLFRDIDHVAVLTDGGGVVLASRGRPTGLAREWKMEPGFDWSEEARGATCVARAVASGDLEVAVGGEAEPFHAFACAAVAVRGEAERISGALGLAVRLPDADPHRMILLAYMARRIEAEMARRR